jgi:hypothetical protein
VTTRARVVVALRAALAVSWFGAAVITHLPAPKGVAGAPGAQRAVTGVWQAAGRAARWLGRLVPDGLIDLVSPFVSDKTIHFGISLVLAFLWAAIRATDGRLDRRSAAAIAVVLTLYAGLSELAQSAMGRIADPGDFLANALGAVLGVLGVYLARERVAPLPLAC